MAINIGYLTSNKTSKADEMYTPYYAVAPLLKYLPKDKIIWCPCDEEWSAYYNLLKLNGYKVIRSSISEGQDFLYMNLLSGTSLLLIHHLVLKIKY